MSFNERIKLTPFVMTFLTDSISMFVFVCISTYQVLFNRWCMQYKLCNWPILFFCTHTISFDVLYKLISIIRIQYSFIGFDYNRPDFWGLLTALKGTTAAPNRRKKPLVHVLAYINISLWPKWFHFIFAIFYAWFC